MGKQKPIKYLNVSGAHDALKDVIVAQCQTILPCALCARREFLRFLIRRAKWSAALEIHLKIVSFIET